MSLTVVEATRFLGSSSPFISDLPIIVIIINNAFDLVAGRHVGGQYVSVHDLLIDWMVRGTRRFVVFHGISHFCPYFVEKSIELWVLSVALHRWIFTWRENLLIKVVLLELSQRRLSLSRKLRASVRCLILRTCLIAWFRASLPVF